MAEGGFYYVRPSRGEMAAPVDRPRELDGAILRKTMYGGEIDDWEPRFYTLTGELVDLQPELRGLKLCSDRLKEVLDEERADIDVVQWPPATVEHHGTSYGYWVLHFPEFPDVVDRARSTFQVMKEREFVNHAVLDSNKVVGRRLLASPERFLNAFVVAEEIRLRLVAEGFVGPDFEPVQMS